MVVRNASSLLTIMQGVGVKNKHDLQIDTALPVCSEMRFAVNNIGLLGDSRQMLPRRTGLIL